MKPADGWEEMLLIALSLAPALIYSWREKSSRFKPLLVALFATILLIAPIGLVLFHFGWKLDWLFALSCGLFGQVIALGYGFAHLYMEQQRLSYQRQAAEEASRLKGQFLTHMAHELRTPLTAIMGFNKINQLDDGLGRSKRIEHSEIIARNCDHLLKLVNDNLDHAKIEAGQMRVLLGAESIDEMVDDVVSTLRPIATEKGLFLEARFERPLPDALLIDAFRVRQVLLNLVGNALKFTQVGRVDILVQWRDRRLDVSVTDTGPGIPKEAAVRIFEAFQQGEADSAVKRAGTGLGLSIARSLVRLMGGDIELESWPGQGSRFHFWCLRRQAVDRSGPRPGMTCRRLTR